MTDVRLYGRGYGYGSHARVTAGFRSVLEQCGRLAGFCDLDLLEDQASPLGSSARIGVFTGPLSLMWRMTFNATHKQRWVMVAPNSTEIGKRITQELEAQATHVMAPSEWAASVLRSKLSLPVVVVPHGVEKEFCLTDPYAALEDPDELTVLHLSSSDRQRKGTSELVDAWKLVKPMLPRRARLVMVVERQSLLMWHQRLRPEDGIMVRQRLGPMGVGLSPAEMAQIYRQVHVVAQPSRGEAFGMVPLEARCCGTPVLATTCTGHSQHMEGEDAPGVLGIPTGGLAAIDDLPGALAPSLRSDAIAQALAELGGPSGRDHWRRLCGEARAGAPQLSRTWSWSRQLSTWVEAL